MGSSLATAATSGHLLCLTNCGKPLGECDRHCCLRFLRRHKLGQTLFRFAGKAGPLEDASKLDAVDVRVVDDPLGIDEADRNEESLARALGGVVDLAAVDALTAGFELGSPALGEALACGSRTAPASPP